MDYVLNIIPQMMDGCLVSFQVFIITIVLSIPLGILLSLGRVSGIKPLQALIGGTWKNVRYVKLTTTSLYAFAWKPSSRVDYKFRVVKPADSLNYTGISPAITLVVR